MPQVNAPYVHTTDWTQPRNAARAAESRGKNSRQARGSWLADLAALRKAITLCFACRARWGAKANGYVATEVIPGWQECMAECDGCRNHARCTMFKPQEK